MSRTAIVTGAAGGIGAAVAARLAADGNAVAIFDLKLDDCAHIVAAITDSGGRAEAFAVDVSDEAAVNEAVARVATELGPPTIVVNNAGVTRDNLLFKMTTDDWDAVMGVHLRGTFLVSRAAQQHMVAEKFGRIVNISSTGALGNRGQANYSTAKAGLQGFTKTLAIELGPFGVTVNSVAPGFIVTDMTRGTAARLNRDWSEYESERAAQIPVRRAGQPADIANAVAFFASEDSGFVSGQVIYVAGGPRG